MIKKIIVRILLASVILFVSSAIFVAGYAFGSLEPKTKTYPDANKLFQIVNEWRTENGYQPYLIDQRLCDIADIRLAQTSRNWSHDEFIPTIDRYFQGNYSEKSENLARDFYDEQSTLKAWLNSPTHKENLDKDYQYSCIALDGNYVVQIFGNF